jgi:hypothetical protein
MEDSHNNPRRYLPHIVWDDFIHTNKAPLCPKKEIVFSFLVEMQQTIFWGLWAQ